MKTKLYLFGALACCSIYANATPYVYISNAQELADFRDAVNSNGSVVAIDDVTHEPNSVSAQTANVQLMNDIDLSSVCGEKIGSWKPIGDYSHRYSGVIDGNGYTISNLYIHNTSDNDGIYKGLFGFVSNLEINKLNIEGRIIANSYVGGLIGYSAGESKIADCHIFCHVTGTSYIGGVLGSVGKSCIITKCSNSGTVSGSEYVGGIAGQYRGELSYCSNYGTVSGEGGLIGNNSSTSTKLSSCVNYGDVDYSGGVNVLYGGKSASVENCYYNSSAKYSSIDSTNSPTPKDAASFASGEVAYLLNNGSDVWKQNIGVDPYPVLEGKTVYKHELEDGVVYSNSNELDVIYYGDGSSKEVIQTTDFTPTDNSFLVTKNENIGGYNVVFDNGDGDYSCNEFHLVDGQGFSSPIAFDLKKLTYDRPATASSIVTVVLPARILTDHLKGSKYVFSKFDGANVYFSSFEEDSMQANRPYVVKPEDSETEILEDGTYGAVVEPTRSMAEIEYNGLSNFGVYEQSSFSSDGHYSYIIFSSGKLKKYNKINLSPFRAGFRLDLDASNVSSTLGLVFDNDLSGVVLVENDQFVTGKVNVFDVQGRLVRASAEATTCFEGLKKGIYIVNGTKYKLELETKTQTTLKRASASNGFAE